MARRLRLASLACALSFSIMTADARAQSPEEINIARQTAVEGLTAYRAGEFTKAAHLFEQARAIYPSAQILRMHGYTLMALEQWEKAVEALQGALASTTSPLNDADRSDVQDQLGKAMSHFGTVTVSTSLTDAELILDGGEPRTMPLREPLILAPGKHQFVLRAPAHVDAVREVEIVGGKAFDVSLEPETLSKPTPKVVPPKATPKPPPDTSAKPWFKGQRTVGFILGGTGVGLGAGALVTALVGADLRSQVADDVAKHEATYGKGCSRGDPRLCAFDIEVTNSDADRADTLRDASVWMGVGAGVLVAGGVVLVAFSGSEEPKPSTTGRSEPSHARAGAAVACSPGLGGMSCAGSF